MIPGARVAALVTCSFRDHHRELLELNAEVFGISTQAPEYQREMAERLHLLFEILSDAEFKLCEALRLRTFEIDGMLMKCVTMLLRAGRIEHVLSPSFRQMRAPARSFGGSGLIRYRTDSLTGATAQCRSGPAYPDFAQRVPSVVPAPFDGEADAGLKRDRIE